VKPHSASADRADRSNVQGLPGTGSQQANDRLYWKFASDLLFIARPTSAGRFVYEAINPAFETLVGISSEEIRQTAIRDCMRREDARSVYAVLDACLEKGAEVHLCHRLALGGTARNIETVVAPICDPLTGAIVRLIGSHRIASEGPAEAALERASDYDTGINAKLASIQEDIQQRIASDLHDSTCQHLIAASLGVMRLRGSLSEPVKTGQLCDDIDASIDRALRELRAFAYLLHPQDLVVAGLKATIEQYAEGFAARTSLKASSRISTEVDRLPFDIQRSLLRIVQEALTNVFRHAKATEVEIAIEAVDKNFVLSVSDNGRGMSAGQAGRGAKTASLGVGIPAMRARLQQIGGTLEIHSRDTDWPGTKLRAVFPRGLAARSVKRRRNHQHSRKQVMNEMADR
jgi:two-component system NarL family sensor kinase